MKPAPNDNFVRDWLVKTEGRTPDSVEGTRQVMSRLHRTAQVRRWWPRTSTGTDSRGVLSTMFSAAKFITAATIVALFGGLVLVGFLMPRGGTGDPPVVGASGDTGPSAINWQSAIVDLQADSMTLQIGDETYTTEGVDVVVDSYDGDLEQWALYPRWVEDGKTFWMYLDFQSDGQDWRVYPWIWHDAVAVNGPGENYSIEFPQPQIRTPLGEAFEGDWVLTDRLVVPTCDPERQARVDVTMTFKNLRLSVSPRQPSFLDQLADDWFHRGSMLGDIFKGPLEHPESRLLECPEATDE